MKEVRLAVRADADLDDIFYFGLANFGEAKTDEYVEDLLKTFDLLSLFPFMGPELPDTQLGARVHHHRRHSIIYFVRDDHILIVRIARDGTDLQAAMKELS